MVYKLSINALFSLAAGQFFFREKIRFSIFPLFTYSMRQQVVIKYGYGYPSWAENTPLNLIFIFYKSIMFQPGNKFRRKTHSTSIPLSHFMLIWIFGYSSYHHILWKFSSNLIHVHRKIWNMHQFGFHYNWWMNQTDLVRLLFLNWNWAVSFRVLA